MGNIPGQKFDDVVKIDVWFVLNNERPYFHKHIDNRLVIYISHG